MNFLNNQNFNKIHENFTTHNGYNFTSTENVNFWFYLNLSGKIGKMESLIPRA
jgi:hypothetical protein